jgi:hypothetical protein
MPAVFGDKLHVHLSHFTMIEYPETALFDNKQLCNLIINKWTGLRTKRRGLASSLSSAELTRLFKPPLPHPDRVYGILALIILVMSRVTYNSQVVVFRFAPWAPETVAFGMEKPISRRW